jgi:type II pantothenate kinase
MNSRRKTGAFLLLAISGVLTFICARKRKKRDLDQLRLSQIVANPNNVKLGIDIGGTLSKVVYFEPTTPSDRELVDRINSFADNPVNYGRTGHRHLEHRWYSPKLGGTFHFTSFETASFSRFLNTVKSSAVLSGIPFPLCTTGGGAFKYKDRMKEQLGIKLQGTDEIASLVRGIDFMVRHCPDECYYLLEFELRSEAVYSTFNEPFAYPFLVVNIGSGVSILQVNSPTSFQRVGGTALGGGTFLGLSRALTGCKTYNEAINLALSGTTRNVNLTVGGIYGGDYDNKGIFIKQDAVARYFGNVGRAHGRQETPKPSNADLARSALLMITNNIAAVANLYARKADGRMRILYTGSFLRNNTIALKTLAHASDYWSNGLQPALFLKHDGFFGAVGCMVDPDPLDS